MPVTPDWWSAVPAPTPAAAAPSGRSAPPPAGAGGDESVEAYIRSAAAQRGIDPDVAVRVAQSEGGLVPNRTGSFATGKSFWPLQLHYGGAGTPYASFGTVAGMGNAFTEKTGWQPGDPNAWRAATDYALDAAQRQGWGAWYGARNQGIIGFQGITRGAAAAPPPAARPPASGPAPAPAGTGRADAAQDAPEWWRAIPGARDLSFRSGRDEGPGVQPLPTATAAEPDWWQPLRGAPGAAGDPGGLVWPLAGQSRDSARINNPFGAPQVRSAGFGGSLPALNYGVDLGARLGDPVVAPAAGVVKQVLSAAGPNYGYGNSVVVDLGGGREVQLSHFTDAPAVRVGQRVSPGDLLGHAGMSGNATGVHLDAAARENGRPVDFLGWFGGARGTASAPAAPGGPAGAAPAAPDWWAAVTGR